MQENNSQNAIIIIDRLKNLLEIKSDSALAEFLNIRPNTLSTWKSRNSVDYSAIIEVCKLYEIDLNFLFLGQSQNVSKAEIGFSLITTEKQFQYVLDKKSVMDGAERLVISGFDEAVCQGFVVSTNNMFPILEENGIAICEQFDVEKVNSQQEVVVLVSKTSGIFFGYLSKIGTNYKITYENKFGTKIFFQKEDILEVWKVKANISLDLMANKKIKYLRNSVSVMPIAHD